MTIQQLEKKVAEARAARLKTVQAVHVKPGDTKASEADNAAYAAISAAEDALRKAQGETETTEENPDASMR